MINDEVEATMPLKDYIKIYEEASSRASTARKDMEWARNVAKKVHGVDIANDRTVN